MRNLSSQPGGRRDAVADQPCSQTMEIGNGEERLRAEPWISLFFLKDQDGGFGGHRTGGWTGGQVRERPPKTCAILEANLGLFILIY